LRCEKKQAPALVNLNADFQHCSLALDSIALTFSQQPSGHRSQATVHRATMDPATVFEQGRILKLKRPQMQGIMISCTLMSFLGFLLAGVCFYHTPSRFYAGVVCVACLLLANDLIYLAVIATEHSSVRYLFPMRRQLPHVHGWIAEYF
jgi:hypothetical protein